MKKILIFTLSIFLGVVAYAADFKVGEAKYQVLPDGTVELKEFKKATGDVLIPEKVTDPKTGKEYTVSAIGIEAFKKSPMTSVTLPQSVTTLGSKSFMDCENLTNVKCVGDIATIPSQCFYKCTSLTNLEMNLNAIQGVDDTAFQYCKFGKIAPIAFFLTGGQNLIFQWGVLTADQKDFVAPIYIYPDVDVTVVDALIQKVFPSKENIVFVFMDPNPGQAAIDIFALVSNPTYMNEVKHYLNEVAWGRHPDPLRKALDRSVRQSHDKYYGYSEPIEHPNFIAYFGPTIDEGTITDYGEGLTGVDAITKSADDVERNNFLSKLNEFVRVAVEEPENLSQEYKKISPEDALKFNPELTNVIRVLCDSVYLVKPELSEAELKNLSGFINNLMEGIGASYGIENMRLEQWAKKDVLTTDLASGEHKEDYERILKTIERYFKFEKVDDAPYQMANQLACLCALERWKEAAAYFPKVHRTVTGNGKYYALEPPYEITYMQKAINDHGYKAIAPTYGKGSKQGSSSDSGNLIEFFTDKAIQMGIDHYQKKKREKKARELFYESMGLDKKGRPKKK